MKIEYLHASKYGDGAMVAEEFSRRMSARGVAVDVHHIREAKPGELPPADPSRADHGSAQRQHRVGGQPVLHHVVIADHVRQRRI
jgi:hypothetical protein